MTVMNAAMALLPTCALHRVAPRMCVDPNTMRIDVSKAAREVGPYLMPTGSASSHLDARDSLIGSISSSELLEHDEVAGLWPALLDKNSSTSQYTFVDESECVGCTFCVSIARATFRMEEDGKARVIQQGEPEPIHEAIDSCPVNCIHTCNRQQLRDLEEARAAGSFPWLAEWNDQIAATAVRSRVPDAGPKFPGIEEQQLRIAAARKRHAAAGDYAIDDSSGASGVS